MFGAFHAAVYPAFWVRGEDLGDDAVIARVLGGAGLDADAVLAAAGGDAAKAALRATTDEALERGAFGAPSCFVGDEMFWGNDRFELVRYYIQKSQS